MDEARCPSLSLVLPAYNEAEGIALAVAEADDALARFADDYEILVVDDGSRDATAAAVTEVSRQRPRVRLLRHPTNRGYGAALRTGFEAARGARVAFTDADGQFDLADLERLVSLSRRFPVVVGYRIDRQDPWRRRFYSWGYNQLVRRLIGTGVRDCDCALKVFHRDALAQLLPDSTHFFVNTEMLARARQRGLAVAEVGVRHRPRRHGHSKVSLADVPRTLAVLLPFWWSRVLFVGREHSSPRVATRGPWPAVALFTLTCLLFFCRLRAPLLEPEEVRYAEVPRQMLAADRWLVPVLHGQDYLDKPPLFYWLVMGSYRVFGVHDWSARLAAGLVGVLTVAVVYGWGRRMLGPRGALLAAALLALTPEFVYRGRMVTTNGLLGLWTTAALAAAHIALSAPTLRRGWWLAAGVALGLGLLTKGPVALALVLPPVMAVAWLDRRLAQVGGRGWSALVGMACLVAAPWYVAVAQRCPEFGGYFFWFHNVVRYVAPFDHAKPAWAYLPQLLLGLMPWTLLLVPLGQLLFCHGRRAASRRPAALGLALVAAVWGFVFFSLSGSKRPVYLLPVMPPLALALGCYLDATLPRLRLSPAWAALWRYRTRVAYWSAAAVLLVGVIAGTAAYAAELRKAERGLPLAAAAGVGLVVLLRRERRLSWLPAGAATFALLWVGTHDLLPGYAARFSLRRAARPELVAPAVYCYPQPFDAVSFYLRRDDVQTFRRGERRQLMTELLDQPGALLFVKSSHLPELLTDLPACLEFVPADREAGVTVGRVLARPEAPVATYARASDRRSELAVE